jgi:hypothetical protein
MNISITRDGIDIDEVKIIGKSEIYQSSTLVKRIRADVELLTNEMLYVSFGYYDAMGALVNYTKRPVYMTEKKDSNNKSYYEAIIPNDVIKDKGEKAMSFVILYNSGKNANNEDVFRITTSKIIKFSVIETLNYDFGFVLEVDSDRIEKIESDIEDLNSKVDSLEPCDCPDMVSLTNQEILNILNGTD